MKLAATLLIVAWVAFAAWLGSMTSNQTGSIPADMGFADEPPAEYEGLMDPREPDCTVKMHLLKIEN